jgi:hypothetical protein
VETGVCTESFPASPTAIIFFIGALLASIKNDSCIRKTVTIHDKIFFGSGEILKFAGIWEGKWVWKRWVRTSSGGS